MTTVAAGDTIWVADDHAETLGIPLTITFPGTPLNPLLVICANRLAAVPTSSDWRTTATISNTTAAGGTVITVDGSAYIYGMTFQATGSTANQTSIQIASGIDFQKWDSCALKITSNSTPSRIFVGSTTGIGNTSRCEWINTTVSFANASQQIAINSGRFTWSKTPSAAVAGVAPTTLFSPIGYTDARVEKGVDLSAVTGSLLPGGLTTGMQRWVFDGCKLGSGVTITAIPITSGGLDVWLNRCDDTTEVYRTEHYTFEGTEIVDFTMVRVGGASDGTTPVSHRVTNGSATASRFFRPYDSIPIASWNSVTGSPVTLNIAAIANSASIPLNDQIWLEASFLGSGSSTLLSNVHNTKANLGAGGVAHAADSTSSWASPNVATRANTTPYVGGNRIKVASNPGRVFYILVAGTTAASEPAGYATAIDGGSVVDGSATFRAAVRFTLSVTCTSPALPGVITAVVKMSTVGFSYTYDPKFNPQLT